MEIIKFREQENLIISRENYRGKVLKRFNIGEAKVMSTPLEAHFKLSSTMSPNTTK